MRHFHRTHIGPDAVVAEADAFFAELAMSPTTKGARERAFTGQLGTVTIRVRPEGGHYTFVEVDTDQMGESRLDRNVKKFFVRVHRRADPKHRLAAAY
jgi:hypothetical protein